MAHQVRSLVGMRKICTLRGMPSAIAAQVRLQAVSFPLAAHPRSSKLHPSVELEVRMKKLFSVTNVLATAGVLFASYVLITSIPDMRRYIRISTM